MRGTTLLLILLLGYWIIFAIKLCNEDVKLTVARKLCDIKGKHLASLKTDHGGFVIRYTCGERKTTPRVMEKP